ncbi:recombination regulator RecX [Bacillus sp. SCS-151]|uniref:recombination regulator RecX n=1 Tax=Nanhaiella sioensis TaxID=3115293 RepID=UPI00397C54F1
MISLAFITKIVTQKKNSERYNVYLDRGKGEEYAFSVDQDVLIKYNLTKGKEIDELDVGEIQFADDVKKAHNVALRYLSYRIRSIKEIDDYLKKNEVPEQIIQEVVHKLQEANYVDDEKFALSYVQTQIKTSIKGPDKIKRELNEKGISAKYAEKAMNTYTTELQIQHAMKHAEKISKQSAKFSILNIKQKIEQTLVRKGFSWDIIQIVIEEISQISGQEENNELEALQHQANKINNRLKKYTGWEYEQKLKQALYRKGFSIELIEEFIQKNKPFE